MAWMSPIGRDGRHRAGADDAGPVHHPQVDEARGVAPEDVRLAVAVEVAEALDGPRRVDGAQGAGGDDAGAVHEPDVQRARGMAPEDVGPAVAVEVGSPVRGVAAVVRGVAPMDGSRLDDRRADRRLPRGSEHLVALLRRMQAVRAIQPWIVQGRERVDKPDVLFRRDAREPGVDGLDDGASVWRVTVVGDDGAQKRDRVVRLGEPDHLPQVRHDDVGGHLEGGVVGAFHDEDESGVVHLEDRRQPGQPAPRRLAALATVQDDEAGVGGGEEGLEHERVWLGGLDAGRQRSQRDAVAHGHGQVRVVGAEVRRQPEPGRGAGGRHDHRGDTNDGQPPHRHSSLSSARLRRPSASCGSSCQPRGTLGSERRALAGA